MSEMSKTTKTQELESEEQRVDVVFEDQGPRSVAYAGTDPIGECEVSVSEGMWLITHTGVRPAYGGQGIARRLVDAVVEEARRRGVKVLPLCSYAKHLMEGSDAYRDVL